MKWLLDCAVVTVICEENDERRPCTNDDVTRAGLCQDSESYLLSFGSKERLFITTQTHNLQIVGVIPFVKLENDT